MKDKNYNMVLNRVLNYLSVRERTEKEIRTYLYKHNWNMYEDKIINFLDENGFLDDIKFVRHYVLDKGKFYHRGPIRIINELLKLGIKHNDIDLVLSEIGDDFFVDNGVKFIYKKIGTVKEDNILKIRNLLYKKGYTGELISKILKKLR